MCILVNITRIPFITNPYSAYRDTIRVDVFVEQLIRRYAWLDEALLTGLIIESKEIYTNMSEKDKPIFKDEFVKQMKVDFNDENIMSIIKNKCDAYSDENIHHTVKSDIDSYYSSVAELAEYASFDDDDLGPRYDLTDWSIIGRMDSVDGYLRLISDEIVEHPNYATEFYKQAYKQTKDSAKGWEQQLSKEAVAILVSFDE